MNILLACGGGMSSAVLAENLIAEAKRQGNDNFTMGASATEEVALKMQQEKWDALLLAPQVSFRKDHMQKEADAHNIPLILIEGILYTPMGVPELYKLIVEKVNKNK